MSKKRKFTNVLDIPDRKEKLVDYIPEETNCWIYDLPDEKYFRLPKAYYSSSGIMSFYQPPESTKGFKYIQKFTPALQIGTYVHNAILAPEELETDRAKEMIADMEKRFKAKYDRSGELLVPSAMEVAEKCTEALRQDVDIMDRIDKSDTELSGIIDNKYFGGSTRIKCDAIDHEAGVLYDIKTSVKPFKAFQASATKKNGQIQYFIQAAHYLSVANLINALNGDPRRYTKFEWLYVGKSDYSTGILECPPELLELGRERVREFYMRMLGDRFEDTDYANI